MTTLLVTTICQNPSVAAATLDQLQFEGAELELPEGWIALSSDLGTERTLRVPSALISLDLSVMGPRSLVCEPPLPCVGPLSPPPPPDL